MLYNKKSPLYHNKQPKQRALKNVCKALKDRPSKGIDIVNKMKSLCITFVMELNKIKNFMTLRNYSWDSKFFHVGHFCRQILP